MDDARIPISRSQVSLKTMATVCFTLLAFVLGLYVVVHARVTLIIVVTALLVAVALHHGVDALIRRGVRRKLAITLVLAATWMVAAGILLLLIPPAINQGQALALQLPDLVDKVRNLDTYKRLDATFHIGARLDEFRQHAFLYLQRAAAPALSALKWVLKGLGAALAVYGLTLFMLIFGERLVRRVLDETIQVHRDRYERVLRKIYDAVGGYLSGLGFICLCNATFTSIFLAIIRLPFFLPLGILSGLSSLVPLVGNTLMGTLTTLIALATGGLWKGVACAAFCILYQQFENHFLGPLVYKRTINVNPLITAIGLLIAGELGGIAGAVIAVPLMAVGQIILRELLAYRRELLNLPRRGPASEPPQDAAPPTEDGQLELDLPEPERVGDYRH